MNYSSTARSNYFKVKDPEKFREFVKALPDVRIVSTNSDHPDTFCIVSDNGWPTYMSGLVDDATDINFFEYLAEFLPDNEVVILMEAGSEGERFVIGTAFAITNKGRICVDLCDIYAKAALQFGVSRESINLCEY